MPQAFELNRAKSSASKPGIFTSLSNQASGSMDDES